MKVEFPCNVCSKPVAKNHKAVCCDKCDKWVHIGCNRINTYTYRKLQKSNSPWFCYQCFKKEIPFAEVSDNVLKNIFEGKELVSPNLRSYLSNHDTLQDIDYGGSISNKYYTPEEFCKWLENNPILSLFMHFLITFLSP